MAEEPAVRVTPSRDDARVGDERDGGGQQAAHRLAKVEAEVAELRQLIRCLLDLYESEEGAPRPVTRAS